jgi:AmmeMemoRadiSam system protein B
MRGMNFLARAVALAAVPAALTGAWAQEPPKAAVPPQGKLRGLADTTGFASKAEQMDEVVAVCRRLEESRLAELDRASGAAPGEAWAGAVCPHDDYVYAGPAYADALRHIRAKTVILFGVCHRARAYGLKDALVFDSFAQWRGPYGPVPVSPLREDLLRLLPAGDAVVHDEVQQVEWSVEAIVPWLQHERRDVEIVPILVPAMKWERTEALAKDLAAALSKAAAERKLRLGEDFALVASCDATHYGDQWDDWAYEPFGSTAEGYIKAQAQDQCLARWYLEGPLTTHKMGRLAESLVDQEDLARYKVTWCGRFSVPLGLATLAFLGEALGRKPFEGVLTGYSTSISNGFLPFDKVGLGATAHENLHHWVSYVAAGYR